ncbi:TUP1 split protein 1 HIRA enhancer [Thecamonas trahens ATCC 50062]|uniref:Protein HIRA n=1 Tax=Thecamonas trahens ATCC 50062 TaxID=461836 RepID=A0A0L0DKC8_THETB|nr:TUP1 split protein 1 HIRA enhancer [Thecamonas trahens ATCC 50062]KNC51818.1 TUP1 split protein 1 HIRA enhancer [Thecamonas trahens ATCC 50062]|eukprot:XP_013755684.1 TUP1 split protein 1 HIRA enhancer [Thecamonas trahens ATCC 50062]
MAVDLCKAKWVNHGGNPIFSIDIHPSATRFATGGSDRNVKIWSMVPFVDAAAKLTGSATSDSDDESDDSGVYTTSEDDDDDDDDAGYDDDGKSKGSGKKGSSKKAAGKAGKASRMDLLMGSGATGFGSAASQGSPPRAASAVERQHRCLATLPRHQGAINAVRWCASGEFLASGADDKVIIIWAQSDSPTQVFGSAKVNHEGWGFYRALRGHTADVTDLAWSCDDSYLASCGVDGDILVWDTTEFELLATLKGHSEFVKGLAWDPVGKYLASQSNDRSLKIWSTTEWRQVASVAAPFEGSPPHSFFRRCSWSPDGKWLTSAYAYNNTNPVATVLARDTWETAVEFVGHSEPVVVARYNPRLFRIPEHFRATAAAPPASEGETQAQAQAPGAGAVADESKGANSAEGDDEDEASEAATPTKDKKRRKKKSGSSSASPGSPSAGGNDDEYFVCCAIGSQDNSISIWASFQDRPLLIATAMFEHSVMDLSWSDDGTVLMACSYDGTVGCFVFDIESEHVLSQPVSEREHQRILADEYGEFLGKTVHLQEYAETVSLQSISAPSMTLTPRTVSAVRAETEALRSGLDAVKGAHGIAGKMQQLAVSEPVALPPVEQKESITKSGKRRVQPQLLSTLPGAAAPAVLAPRSTSQTGFARPSMNPPVVNTLIPRKRTATRASLGGAGASDPPGASMAPAAGGVSRAKRQRTLTMGEVEPAEPVARLVVSAEDLYLDPPAVTPVKAVSFRVAPAPVLLGAGPSSPSGGDEAIEYALEARGWKLSGPAEAGPARGSSLSLSQSGELVWEAYVPGRVNAVAASELLAVAATFDDGGLHVFSAANGALLSPALVLGLPLVMVRVSADLPRIVALSASGSLRVWEVVGPLARLGAPLGHGHGGGRAAASMVARKTLTVAPLLNSVVAGEASAAEVRVADVRSVGPESDVVVELSNGYVYLHNAAADAWMRVADGSYVGSQYFASSLGFARASLPSGELAAAQLRLVPRLAHQVAPFLAALSLSQQRLVTVGYLEHQVSAALAMGSSSEFEHWMREYVRRLVRDAAEAKLRNVAINLLSTTRADLDGRSLLKALLPEIAQSPQLQKLTAWVTDALRSEDE